MNTSTIVICSHNAKKARELSALLPAWRVLTLADFAPFPQPQENAATFAENAAIKAVESSKNIPHLCLADDSGLCVDALGGAPGVHSARFAGRHGDDAANNQKLLEMLADVPAEKRAAHFACVIAVARDGGLLHSAEGRCHGRIATAPVGTDGFGYDPLFIPDDQPEEAFFSDEKTFAQMSADIKNRISHRAHAMRKMIDWLLSHSAQHSLQDE